MSSSSSKSLSSVSDLTTSSSSASDSSQSLSSSSSESSSSTKSSNSSTSSESSSSLNSSSSSISSESSEWDIEWFSLLYCPKPAVREGQIIALVEVDIRHSDADILAALGPLTLDFGGEFGETVLSHDPIKIIDGLRVSKTFDVVEDAEDWQDSITFEFRNRMNELRNIFLNQYPGEFDLRHRRV